MKFRIGIIGAGALALSLLLAGCASSTGDEMEGMDHSGGSGSTEESTSADFNMADETFVLMMIPHHQQAIEMVEVLQAKEGVDSRVLEIAEQIRAAQQPEIATMKGWLDSWGVPEDSMQGMDHGNDGMMSADEMAALGAASGADASRLFLEQMIEHHTGAVDMAQQELDNGQNADARALAEDVLESQTAEIDQMNELLAQL